MAKVYTVEMEISPDFTRNSPILKLRAKTDLRHSFRLRGVQDRKSLKGYGRGKLYPRARLSRMAGEVQMIGIPLQDVCRSGAIPTADESFWGGAMAWTKPQYSRGKTDKSGAILIAPAVSESQKNEAMSVMGNWRSAHSYPLELALRTLRRKALGIDRKAIIASRLKRFPAIALKLKREPMRLSQM